MPRHIRLVSSWLTRVFLLACVLQAVEAKAGVIIVGTQIWERHQCAAISVSPKPARPLTDVERGLPWPGERSIGAGGASASVVQTRRDDTPQLTRKAVPPMPRPTSELREGEPRRLPPPCPHEVYRPPKGMSAATDVIFV